MAKIVIVLALAAAAAACSPTVIGGNENSVIVNTAGSGEGSFKVAEEHCAKYGRKPRLTQRSAEGGRYIFDCVP